MKVLCAGAGGSGMGAIVRWHLELGDTVFAHDDGVADAELLKRYPGAHAWMRGADVDRGVFSDAVPSGHPIRREFDDRKTPAVGFSEELGALCAGRYVIAVAGTHGKSTTTALLSWMFAAAGRDPLCVIGADVSAWRSNFRYGGGLVIVEADEYRKHFLHLDPAVVLVTSLEMDHFDTYPSEQDLLSAFIDFCSKPSVKKVFIARGGQMVEKIAQELSARHVSAARFGGRDDAIRADTVAARTPACPHVSNLLGAAAVAGAEGLSENEIERGVESFPGILRRMEKLGEIGSGVPVYSDYAHHPTAVRETLRVCRDLWPDRKLGVIFEPHERLRTSRLKREYEESFAHADAVALLPVFEPTGRERNDIPQEQYQLEVPGADRLADYPAAIAWAEAFAERNPRGTVVIMGAGPIDGAFRKTVYLETVGAANAHRTRTASETATSGDRLS